MKILVVDDSKVHRMLMGGLLEEEAGLEIDYAVDGRDALDKIEAAEQKPDLIITDLVMPNLDGLELVSEIRETYPAVPVVLVTSQGSEEIAARALAAGATSYVPKTSLSEMLVETVDDLLEDVDEVKGRAAALTSMVNSEVEFELENRRALFSPLLAYFKETLQYLGFGDDNDRMRICMALEEALSNAAEHGNLELDSDLREGDRNRYVELARERLEQSPYRDRRVQVRAFASRDEVRVVIRDQGSGFDPSGLPDPTDPSNMLKPSGRGVMLMRTFMDEVSFNDRGNEVTLVKRRPAS